MPPDDVIRIAANLFFVIYRRTRKGAAIKTQLALLTP